MAKAKKKSGCLPVILVGGAVVLVISVIGGALSGDPEPSSSPPLSTPAAPLVASLEPSEDASPDPVSTTASSEPEPEPEPEETTEVPAPTPEPEEQLDPDFGSCGRANDAGYGNYRRGVDPEYDWYRDADKDGIVCEF